MVAVVWAAILSGFVYNNVRKFYAGTLTYPWIVHVHGLAFLAWLLLFTSQVSLVRRSRLATHRRLGAFGVWLAPLMVVLGLMTAIITEKLKFGTPIADARFLSVMFADMIAFGGLIAAGMLLRRSPEAHKRLMLVATLVLTDAGFGRWLSPQIGAWIGQRNFWEFQTFGEGAWPFVRFQLLPAYVLIASIGIFDLVTRKRLHPAYVGAVAWCAPLHLLAGWLYFQPFWNKIALSMIGH
jgi:hypothetical protein